ncbi:peroxisomal adenine nucleotide carrier 1-like [Iris pallida]|uniref:Peroxisomal adenine nucleotide carrier 1-like n=1 Tax=Iris pallida TaxID=29817 RepID=A0AAX6G4U7_IRIPA|nr:peroxisomal adenine nucleotide carrier 1-like [Iris pallida]
MYCGKQFLLAKFFHYTRDWELRICNHSYHSLSIFMDIALSKGFT